jgi:tetratricopeptide (TPR) repeat protein
MKQQLEETPQPDTRHNLFLGALLARYDAFDEALVYLNRALELSPDKQSVIFEITNTYWLKGDTVQALATAKQAFDLAPAFTEARLRYLIIALRAQQTTLAQQLISGLDQEVYFSDDRILSALADAKQYTNVINILKKRVEQNPTDPQRLLSLAAGYLAAGDRQQSIAVLRDFIALDPAQYTQQGEYYIKEIQAGRNP